MEKAQRKTDFFRIDYLLFLIIVVLFIVDSIVLL